MPTGGRASVCLAFTELICPQCANFSTQLLELLLLVSCDRIATRRLTAGGAEHERRQKNSGREHDANTAKGGCHGSYSSVC